VGRDFAAGRCCPCCQLTVFQISLRVLGGDTEKLLYDCRSDATESARDEGVAAFYGQVRHERGRRL
jgi:hypothetical protein